MILLNARDLSRQFDAEPVFRNISFEVRQGERIGLVGPNGVGKTTLLRILAGIDQPDVGTVERHRTTRSGYLEQDKQFLPGRTLIEEAREGLAEIYALQRLSEELASKMAESSEGERLHREYDRVQSELIRLRGYNVEHRVQSVLKGLGFVPEQFSQEVLSLSGGQQNRLVLAKLLVMEPNLLLLDEPTNHLDIETTEWLEKYLCSSDQAMIIVSHDRFFLDQVATQIFEITKNSLTAYPGNFTAYWKQREERALVQERIWEKQQEEIADMEDFIRRNHYGQKASQAHDREKKLARIERVEKMQDFQSANISFGRAARSGDVALEASGLAKGFGTPLFEDLNLRIERGSRVGIFGPNGTGKTTLLRTLIGELEPDEGIVRFGAGIELGYFDQQLNSIDSNLDLIEAIRPEKYPDITPGTLRDVLGRFGLKGDIVFQKVGSLSGGERNRVALARISVLNVNLLILDEPTNHLDIWACDSLEKALKLYEGTVIFVSHDRYFLDRVADHVLAFDGPRLVWQAGNYSIYLDTKRRRTEELGTSRESNTARKNREKNEKTQSTKRKRKFPFRKIEDLERDLAHCEEDIARLEQELVNPQVLRNPDLARKTQSDYEQAKSKLQQLYEHWEEACELG